MTFPKSAEETEVGQLSQLSKAGLQHFSHLSTEEQLNQIRQRSYDYISYGVIQLREFFGDKIQIDPWCQASYTVGCHSRSNGNQCYVYA